MKSPRFSALERYTYNCAVVSTRTLLAEREDIAAEHAGHGDSTCCSHHRVLSYVCALRHRPYYAPTSRACALARADDYARVRIHSPSALPVETMLSCTLASIVGTAARTGP